MDNIGNVDISMEDSVPSTAPALSGEITQIIATCTLSLNVYE
jgi:hypothetical protein